MFQTVSLLSPLIQLAKIGFTKVTQRLEGIYALLLVARIAAIDGKSGMLNACCLHVRFLLY